MSLVRHAGVYGTHGKGLRAFRMLALSGSSAPVGSLGPGEVVAVHVTCPACKVGRYEGKGCASPFGSWLSRCHQPQMRLEMALGMLLLLSPLLITTPLPALPSTAPPDPFDTEIGIGSATMDIGGNAVIGTGTSHLTSAKHDSSAGHSATKVLMPRPVMGHGTPHLLLASSSDLPQ